MADATPGPWRLLRGPRDRKSIPGRLRREFLLAAGGGIALLAAGSVILSPLLPAGTTVRWGVVAFAVAAVEFWLLRSGLPWNRADSGRIRGSLGRSNALTVARGLLIAGVAGFLAVPPLSGAARWLPGGLYSLAVVVDGIDGVVARRWGATTALGAALDSEFDGLGLLVGSALAVAAGRLPPWYLAAGLARYAYVAALVVHRTRGGSVSPIPPSAGRRLLAVAQMLVVAGALLPLGHDGAVWVIATVAMVPFLAGFVRDWLAATRRRTI